MGRDIGAREESERAIEFFREALRLDPQYALAHVGLSTAYEYLELHLGMSALETALAEANKAIELDSNLAEGYAARSRAAMGLGQMELALTDSRRAIELDPNHASATRIRMLLTYWTGRLDESLIWSERLRSLEPTVGLHPAWVGMLYFQLGMYDAAIRELRKVEESEAGNAGGHSGAVYIHMARGELDKAAEEARKARALQPDSLEVIRASIRLELRRDNYDWVTPYIEEAMEKVAQRYKPFTYLGYAYQKTEERDKAEKVLREAEQYYTRQLEDKSNMRPVSCVHLLQVHLVRGEIDEAVRWFGEWIDAGGRGYEFLQIDPIYDDLWEDERALALLEGVKTEVAEMRERVEQEDI